MASSVASRIYGSLPKRPRFRSLSKAFDKERKGTLQRMLLEAEEKTKDEMATLRMELMKLGKTAQQAQTQAWEMVREKYILLPVEET